MAVARALISVFDKTGIVEFAKRLAALGIEMLSTGGTSKLLRDAQIPVRDVADFTGWPEMLGGRVKTLHPKVHGGLLYRRRLAEDQKQAAEHGIQPIDLVVVNLYPFEATAEKPQLTAEELNRGDTEVSVLLPRLYHTRRWHRLLHDHAHAVSTAARTNLFEGAAQHQVAVVAEDAER